MIQTLVSSKYQVVIPKKVRKEAGVKPGQKLNIYTSNGQIVLTQKKKVGDYLEELRGLWGGVDVKAYIDEERNAWE